MPLFCIPCCDEDDTASVVTLHDSGPRLCLQKQGYVSRAAYKLLEIQKKHKVIRPGELAGPMHGSSKVSISHKLSASIRSKQCTYANHKHPDVLPIQTAGGKVLDLGCVPGAWLQVACQQLGPRDRGGLVLGVDIQEVSIPQKHCDDRVFVLQADARMLTPEVLEQYTQDVSVVVSRDRHCDSHHDISHNYMYTQSNVHGSTGHCVAMMLPAVERSHWAQPKALSLEVHLHCISHGVGQSLQCTMLYNLVVISSTAAMRIMV